MLVSEHQLELHLATLRPETYRQKCLIRIDYISILYNSISQLKTCKREKMHTKEGEECRSHSRASSREALLSNVRDEKNIAS